MFYGLRDKMDTNEPIWTELLKSALESGPYVNYEYPTDGMSLMQWLIANNWTLKEDK